jgi:transcriptional regulator with XRE-family HTH domain
MLRVMNDDTLNPLRTLRKAKGWTLDELSRVSSVPKSTISRIERGLQEPSTTTLVKLANALDLRDLAALASQWTR